MNKLWVKEKGLKAYALKKITAAVLTVLLLAATAWPVSAADTPSHKDEVVYAILNPDGSVGHIYVVNIFKRGEITDYGDYSDVRNLTTSEKITQSGDRISVSTNADRLYYQGTLAAKELPWNIAIRYNLNGRAVSGPELAGKTGALEIRMSVTQNPKINRTFFDNYALQITLQLDTKLCDNIRAENANMAEAGSKKQLTYTVLPGKDAEIAVTTDVHDFEMDAVTINGIKLTLSMSLDDDELTGQLAQLAAAIREIDNGAGGLLEGVNELADGMNRYLEGLKAYTDGLQGLNSGISELDSGAAGLKNGLAELSGQNVALVNGAMTLQQGAFDAVNAQLAATGSQLPVLTPQNYSTVLGDNADLAALKAQLDGTVQFTQGLKRYTDGVAQLGTGASALADGSLRLKASASPIASSADDLYQAGASLNLAVKKLRDGLASYKNGTQALRNATANMDTQISDTISGLLDSITGKGDKVISFVSDKNTNISSVQFAIKTGAIKRQKTADNVPGQPAPLTFRQKLLKLFGLAD